MRSTLPRMIYVNLLLSRPNWAPETLLCRLTFIYLFCIYEYSGACVMGIFVVGISIFSVVYYTL